MQTATEEMGGTKGWRDLWVEAAQEQDEMLTARGWPTPREVNLAVTKGGLLISLLIAFVHFMAPLYMRAEQRTINWYVDHRNAVVAAVAEDFGYVRPPEKLTEFTRAEWMEHEAIANDLNPAYVRAVAAHESAGDRYALSKAGAIGLMQIMPENAKFCGLRVGELYDEKKNISCGVKLLADAMRRYHNDPFLATQAYNGGPTCVGGYHESIKCRESAAEAKDVLRRMSTDTRV